MASSCGLVVKLADLQDIIKNQTKLAEAQTQVIEDQKRMIEKQAAVIDDLGRQLTNGKRIKVP